MGSYCIHGAVKQHLRWAGICSSAGAALVAAAPCWLRAPLHSSAWRGALGICTLSWGLGTASPSGWSGAGCARGTAVSLADFG